MLFKQMIADSTFDIFKFESDEWIFGLRSAPLGQKISGKRKESENYIFNFHIDRRISAMYIATMIHILLSTLPETTTEQELFILISECLKMIPGRLVWLDHPHARVLHLE